MKVLFISNLFPDTAEPYRGLDNATLLHNLAGDCQIRILCPRPALPLTWRAKTPRKEDVGFSPVYIPARYIPKSGSRWNHRLMATSLREPVQRFRREFCFDVVLCSWLYPDACAVSILAEEFNFPFVAIAQGSDVHQYLRMPLRRKAILRGLLRCARVITRSAELGRILSEAGLAREKLCTIYNGVDLATFQPGDRELARRELGLALDMPVVLFVGNFLAIKDPLLLVRSHVLLCRGGVECSLLMIGAGELETQIRREAGSNVRLLGQLPPAQIAKYMQAADVLCVPSKNEGLPNVILEAIASGLRVVATDVGGIAEVINDDYLGKLVSSGNEYALTDALRGVLGQRGDCVRIRSYAQQFSWQQSVFKYLQVLAKAIALGVGIDV